jgi:hypothetical protein
LFFDNLRPKTCIGPELLIAVRIDFNNVAKRIFTEAKSSCHCQELIPFHQFFALSLSKILAPFFLI